MGLEAVRDWLRRSPPSRTPLDKETFQLANSELSRADLIAWIQWNGYVAASRENWRFWLTFAFVFIGAVAAVIAAFESWR
jgi:hypothetical protein